MPSANHANVPPSVSSIIVPPEARLIARASTDSDPRAASATSSSRTRARRSSRAPARRMTRPYSGNAA